MEEAFNTLKNDGINCVDNLMMWIKDSKLIDNTKEAEDKALKLFEDVKDKENVEFEKFKEVVGKLAADMKKTEAEFGQMLVDAIPKLQEALAAAAAAFQAAMAKK